MRNSADILSPRNREHHITTCVGLVNDGAKLCGKQRVRLTRKPGGEAWVCINPRCSLYTSISRMNLEAQKMGIENAWKAESKVK